MLLSALTAVSERVAATSSRLDKVALLAAAIRDAGAYADLAVAYLAGETRENRMGVGYATVRSAMATEPAVETSLTLDEVKDVFARLAGASGAGSTSYRTETLRTLFARATAPEQQFLARLICGELRQGALEGVLADAVARAAGVPADEVRRAAMYAGDLATVAAAALQGGVPALRAFGVQLFRPLQPMLAQPAADVHDVLARLEEAAFDYKLDGARVQVHRQGDVVRVYTRGLNEVTDAVPELVEQVRSLPARELVLDGEAIALRADGRPQPFQVTMKRFGTRTDVVRMREQQPLATFFFDLLYVDGQSLMDAPTRARMAALSDVVDADGIVPRLVTASAADAERFMAQARAAGHEGLVAKSLDAGYDAGRRGGSWLKLKQADTLDLVVLAAEWGSGRRQGWLSNLHLGARDPATNSFVMLGKTFKGLTDALLEWQTRELLARELGRDGHIVHVRPELVVEIAYEGVQTSTRYPGGVALRFARVRRYRTDKMAAQADTIDRVRAAHS